MPSWFHAPPSPSGASARTATAPPSISIRLSLPAAKNPTDRLSADQNGPCATSVPGRGSASPPLSRRIHSRDVCPGGGADEHHLLAIRGDCDRHRVGPWRSRNLDPHLGRRLRRTKRARCERGRGHCQQRDRGPPRDSFASRSAAPSRWSLHRLVDRFLEIKASVGEVAQPALQILGQTSFQQPADAVGRGLRQAAPLWLTTENGRHRVGDRVTSERPLTGEHLEEHAAERPHVSPPVHGQAARLLGRHVCGGAKDDPGVCGMGTQRR